ncbi:MAG: OmpH family outer membrane protein [Armatimonadetes bacterium]|nr:OmpH family outer membrane protein [Armatimonadota bacterium]
MLANGRLAVGLAGLALTALLLGSLPAKTAPAKNDATIGYVDLQVVSDEVKKTREWQDAVGEAIKTTEALNRQLQDLEELRYLTEVERKEVETLEAKPKLSDQEKERVASLRGKSAAIDEEYNQLGLLPNATDEQKKRLAEVIRIREAGKRQLQQTQQELQNKVKSLEAKLLSDAQNRVLKLVSEVAQEQNLQLVMDRDAVLFGGRDLTDAVVKKLSSR